MATDSSTRTSSAGAGATPSLDSASPPEATRRLRILFVLDHAGYLRMFDSTVNRLLARGHDITLALNMPDFRRDALETVTGGERRPRVLTATKRRDAYAQVARRLRATMDYTRFLDPRFARAEYYRNKRRLTVFKTGALGGRFAQLRTVDRRWVESALKVLGVLEHAIPSSREVERFIEASDPEVLLVTPLVLDASPQTDYVKSARALGIPSAVCVASWDNLTNKGLMREVPDSVIVWNETQRDEAVDMHGADPAQVTVTGAQSFDRWFGRPPSTDPDEFRRKVDLPVGEPFVLYVGSTSNIARTGVEEEFVRRWLESLREGDDPILSEVPVLVRPHPERPGSWYEGEVGPGEVRLWPPEAPVDVSNVTEEARRDYFDSLYHCTAVVGINTSALLEAAILGKPVLTVRDPDLAQAHEGTLHFDYLLPENGGFLHMAGDFDEHVLQLGAAVRVPEQSRERNERFVRRFIRPNGLHLDCAPQVVEAVERLAGTRPRVPSIPAAVRHPLKGLLWLYVQLEGGGRARTRRRIAKRIAHPLKRLSRRVRPHSRSLARGLKRGAAAIERGSARERWRRERNDASSSEARRVAERLLDPEERGDPSVLARYAERDLSD
jgi:hypothetical protein